MKRWRTKSRKGQVFPMLAVGGVFFFLFAACMVDWIFIFTTRARLITAVDAAAIAATRELTSGASLAQQQATMNRIVEMIFRANFPDGFMMTTSSSYDPPVLDSPGPGARRVRVTGHATLPTFFMWIIGRDEQPIAATAEAVRRDSNVMLVLDRSGSMNYFSGAPWDALNTAVPLFVNEFSEQDDRMGAVFYSTNAFIDYTIQYPKGSMPFKQDIQNIINGHSPGGWTNISRALYLGYRELKDLNDPNALQVIVLFTDGRLTGLTNQFPVNTTSGSSPWCAANPPEPASPRWGTVAACPDIPGSPCSSTTPRGPYEIDQMGNDPIDNCYRSGNNSYTGGGTQAENLVQEIPTAWQLPGYPDLFSVFHPFNSPLPSVPIQLSEPDIITRVGENLTLNIANLARQDGYLIFTIGLGPDVSQPFMQAIANDPLSSFYNPSQPAGEYIFAADSDELVDAFLRVASAVTHLTQ